jgi:hypothetical protein
MAPEPVGPGGVRVGVEAPVLWVTVGRGGRVLCCARSGVELPLGCARSNGVSGTVRAEDGAVFVLPLEPEDGERVEGETTVGPEDFSVAEGEAEVEPGCD